MTDQRAQEIFCQIIARYPGICRSSITGLRSVLWNFMKDSEPWRISVLVAAFESNAASMKMTVDPRVEANAIVEVLENGYGIDFNKAVWAVGAWCKAQGIAWKKPAPKGLVPEAEIESKPEESAPHNLTKAERKCAKCHTENGRDSVYCRNCGSLLVLLCPACETEYHEGDAFCSKCGNRLEGSSSGVWPYAECEAGDTFTLGNFVQGSAEEVEPIEWLVLERDEDKMLVISTLGMACRQYHHTNEPITWEKCSLRRWLNGEFLRKAFSDKEEERIVTVKVDNWDNEKYGTPGGASTEDRAFLLSLDEVKKYFPKDGDLCCKPTPAAAKKGAYSEGSNCWWWLRSPGVDPIYAASIDKNGNICQDGNFVNDNDDCVRPALYLKL